MKNKIYALSLLLSFLIVLSHEVIDHHHHHHHEDLAFGFSQGYEHDTEHNCLQGNLNHQHESKNKEKDSGHNFPFPLHHHYSATHDFDIERTNLLEGNSQIPNASSFLIAYLLIVDFAKPPILGRNLYGEQQFFKLSFFYPAANALRGPPAIA